MVGESKVENGIPILISFCYMLSLKKNGEQTWKPHLASKVYSTLLIPRNILTAMEKEETVSFIRMIYPGRYIAFDLNSPLEKKK